jgi:D-alanyl-D-alanine carboxypeptidase
MMIKNFYASLRLLFLICIFLLSSCIGFEENKKPPLGSHEDLIQLTYAAMKKFNLPGVIAGIWINGKEYWLYAKGKGNLETGTDIKLTDSVRIGSITKTFVSTVALQLVDEGKIKLEDKLYKYIPSIVNSKEISILQLLNHTNGIYDFEELIFSEPMLFDPLKKWTIQELIVRALSRSVYFEPGKGWHYSNTGYILLGMIIEQVTGNSLEEEVRKRIIEPLGLKNTYFPKTPDLQGEYAHGYWDRDYPGVLKDVSRFDTSCEWAVGSMVSNLYDLKIWSDALIQGKLLSKEMHQQQMTWVDTDPKDPDSMKYGLGVFNIGGMIGHTGAVPGYETAMFANPEKGITIIVFVNRFGPRLDDSNLLPLLNEYFFRLRAIK